MKDNKSEKIKKAIYKKWWFWLMVVFGLFILIGIFGNSNDSNDDERLIAPDFSKLTQEEAVTRCNDIPKYCNIKEEYSETIEEGEFVSQNFAEGEKITGDVVVRYSGGLLTVPDFSDVYSSPKNAQNWCEENEVECTITYQYSSTVSSERLISQSVPANDRIKKNTQIDLIYSGLPVIDKEKYEKIKEGMTEEQVWNIIGGKCEALSESGNAVIYSCKGTTYNSTGANASFTFQNGKLVGKAQIGL